MTSKFTVGDTAYFNYDKGEVLEVRSSGRGTNSNDVRVWWDSGVVGWEWESDLLTQEEFDDLSEDD